MMTARSPTASMTAAEQLVLLVAEVVGDSPVVPETTRPSWPVVDQVRRQALGRVEVDRAVRPHGRDHRREDTSERGCVCHGARLAPSRPHARRARPRRGSSLGSPPDVVTQDRPEHEARHYSLGGPSSASPLLPSRACARRYTARRGNFSARRRSAAPLVGDPGEAVVRLARSSPPSRSGSIGGKGDRALRGLVDLGDEEAGGIRHGLAVDLSPADDEDLVGGSGDERERLGAASARSRRRVAPVRAAG